LNQDYPKVDYHPCSALSGLLSCSTWYKINLSKVEADHGRDLVGEWSFDVVQQLIRQNWNKLLRYKFSLYSSSPGFKQ
jgi:hypothetical protein